MNRGTQRMKPLREVTKPESAGVSRFSPLLPFPASSSSPPLFFPTLVYNSPVSFGVFLSVRLCWDTRYLRAEPR